MEANQTPCPHDRAAEALRACIARCVKVVVAQLEREGTEAQERALAIWLAANEAGWV